MSNKKNSKFNLHFNIYPNGLIQLKINSTNPLKNLEYLCLDF